MARSHLAALPVPGATVTATQGDKRITAVTDPQGAYSFPDLTDGVWTIQVEMLGFSTLKGEVTIGPEAQPSTWELKMLPLDQIHAEAQLAAPPKPAVAPASSAPAEAKNPEATVAEAESARDEMAQHAADGLLINGSQNNGASSPFALFPAFGNNRNGGRSLYNGGLGIFVDNSIWDARQFSITGQNTAKPGYNHFTGALISAGRSKFLICSRMAPTSLSRISGCATATTPSARRSCRQPLNAAAIFHRAFIVPKSQISPQALALLNLYPLPNFPGGVAYNYQVPLVGATHQDSLQSRLSQTIDRKNSVFGNFTFKNTRQSNHNVFGFLDTTDSLGLVTSANWFHRFAQGFFGTFGYQFSRWSLDLTPYFENRENVSDNAGIAGNDQSPLDWGPPNLSFSAASKASPMRSRPSTIMRPTPFPPRSFGIAGVTTSSSAATSRGSNSMCWGNRTGAGRLISRASPAGSDFADFLLGIPDAATVAFGNADKYFRDSLYDAFFTDDWRINSAFTLNAGMRWEYGSPITELYGRLVNLDVLPGFANTDSSTFTVTATDPAGLATGQHYPDSLIHPDKRAFEPRVGIAWRPLAASSLVIRAGYGVYYDTSVYQTLATQMAQQFPLV